MRKIDRWECFLIDKLSVFFHSRIKLRDKNFFVLTGWVWSKWLEILTNFLYRFLLTSFLSGNAEVSHSCHQMYPANSIIVHLTNSKERENERKKGCTNPDHQLLPTLRVKANKQEGRKTDSPFSPFFSSRFSWFAVGEELGWSRARWPSNVQTLRHDRGRCDKDQEPHRVRPLASLTGLRLWAVHGHLQDSARIGLPQEPSPPTKIKAGKRISQKVEHSNCSGGTDWIGRCTSWCQARGYRWSGGGAVKDGGSWNFCHAWTDNCFSNLVPARFKIGRQAVC